jgi:poly-beta-1,6-N-acetyl-D-glucosamine synthase
MPRVERTIEDVRSLADGLSHRSGPTTIPASAAFVDELLSHSARAAAVDSVDRQRAALYLPVRLKFTLTLVVGVAWAALSFHLAGRWIADLTALAGASFAYTAIFSIAIIPGFMNAFLATGLLLDRRPRRRVIQSFPGISILVAAYNEEASIASTIQSIAHQKYPGALEVIVINDGSKDATAAKLASLSYPWLRVINLEKNGGKAGALNIGLASVRHALTITVDGDSFLYRGALVNLVSRFLSDPPNTAAVAGAVLVRNSRLNLVTRIQEWDYFHGIAAVKRLQSLFQGTLVAQGAFSIYRTEVLREVGGWADCVGEDIVLTWAFLRGGYRVGFAEDACSFTNAPTTFRQFIRQRQRWSRGLIEAFRCHSGLLFTARMSTLFIWWNLLFPAMDVAYTVLFVPGIILALFGYYWVAGPMTLFVMPLALLINWLMFGIQRSMFITQGLKVRRNATGFLVYSFLYGLILQPACVVGYLKELFGATKTWATK